jgi:hypothetical protein
VRTDASTAARAVRRIADKRTGQGAYSRTESIQESEERLMGSPLGRGFWARPLVRALAGQFGTSGDPLVLRSLGQFVPLAPSAVSARRDPRPDDRGERLLEWSRSELLTYGDAETLLALDESTSWRHA